MPFQVTDAPAGHDIDAVELVTLNGDLGGETAEGVYLFARQARGHCLVDRVLDMEWIHFGHFENEIDVHWEGTRLHIVAQRLKRIPLDQSVEYEPSADIDGVWCTYLIYELNAGALRRIAARTEAEACAAAGLSTGSQAQN